MVSGKPGAVQPQAAWSANYQPLKTGHLKPVKSGYLGSVLTERANGIWRYEFYAS